MKISVILSLLALIGLAGCGSSDAPYYEPKVFVVGDSISLGYTPQVQDDLRGTFTVGHVCGDGSQGHCNNGHASVILDTMHNYFIHGDADVITINTGIHDMSIAPRTEIPGAPCSEQTLITPPAEYFDDLNAIFNYFQQHSKVVIWIDTTTIPSNLCASHSLTAYNQMAEQVARDHNSPDHPTYILKIVSVDHDKEGLHFTELGYQKLGKQVADCIVTAWTGQSDDACIAN